MTEENRFYQPQNSKDALRYIEKLFNSYKDAPLTQELLDYHLKLVNQVQTDILSTAKSENIPSRVTAATDLAEALQQWQRIRMNGKPYNGRIRHFHYEPENSLPKFKRKVIKSNSTNSHRSSRHG
ncbi:hypothetical protein LOSG293_190220 [Secundilactobacillus oryzae JCM 18671]|uniref:Uncharacterized protein n=1 Tax=Secundilactobacillus oryzae JCM 18671 TaxID=1291743 RepID=A0A081BJ97_9LACO|nr:hypothetical protein [Secundilactobacillus oryzae]GAK48115.1 hypothetical protein LOSG293_190220 [Secundilactobacillus oryzae JCM 18671]